MLRTLRAAALAWVVLTGLVTGRPAMAAMELDEAPAHAVKAAFLLNFARFVEWPVDTDSRTLFALCVAGDRGVADALDAMTRGRTIEGRTITVWRIVGEDPVDSCHVLYASGLDRKSSLRLLARVQGSPVFSVSDFDRFTNAGGVSHFFIQDGRMRFAINIEAAQRARLKISSQVLNLAKIVKEEHAQ